MPKESKRRGGGHLPSVRLKNHQTVVQDGAEPHSEIANDVAVPEQDTSESLNDDHSKIPMNKKEKQALKHELFLQRLEASRSPYSKSHERRLRRKAKEQIASGMSDVKAALVELDADIPQIVQPSISVSGGGNAEGTTQRVTPSSRQIGEGKKAPLSKSQRKQALKAERLRIPLILSNPDFVSDPFKTIRTHAQNTLVKHDA